MFVRGMLVTFRTRRLAKSNRWSGKRRYGVSLFSRKLGDPRGGAFEFKVRKRGDNDTERLLDDPMAQPAVETGLSQSLFWSPKSVRRKQ